MRIVFRWVKVFKAVKFSVEDDTRPWRPKTSVTKTNIAAVKIVVTFFQQKISEYCVLNPLEQLTKWPLTSSLS